MTLHLALLLLVPFANPVTADPGSYDDSKSAVLPGGFVLKGEAGVTRSFCFQDNSFPLACEPFPGSLGGGGGARFDISHLTGATMGVRVWAEWTGGFFSPVQGGFGIVVGNDRDDNGPIDSNDAFDDDSGTSDPASRTSDPQTADDEFVLAFSNDGIIGDPCSKDDKDCGDPTDVEAFICIRPDTVFKDVAANGLTPGGGRIPDGAYDELVVSAFLWADADVSSQGNIGAGLAMGTFDIYIEFLGSCGDAGAVGEFGTFC